MNHAKDTIATLIKLGLDHSVAQGFLVFSGVLVIVSFWIVKDGALISISFFTLFYALIAHYLTALRKHESLGEYFVGGDKCQTVLFTIGYIFYFIWWATGTWALLCMFSALNLSCLSLIFFSDISFYAFLFALATTLILFICFFQKLPESINGYYEIDCLCKNCDKATKVKIMKGVSFEKHPCPNCNVVALKKGSEHNRGKVDISISVTRE